MEQLQATIQDDSVLIQGSLAGARAGGSHQLCPGAPSWPVARWLPRESFCVGHVTARLASGRGSTRHDPGAVSSRLIQIPDSQECADLRNDAGHHRHILPGCGTSEWHAQIRESGWWHWAQLNLLSFHGLDDLIHADTMLFILGLTFFVSVIAQTRLLEGITFALLRRNQGAIVPTVISVTAFVAVASAVFGGVSMIGLTIRTLVIVLLLAAAPTSAIIYSVIVCTAITTICGVWVAYGEPPNLIMKANLYPLLGNAFFRHLLRPRGDRQLSADCPPASQETAQPARVSRTAGRHRSQRPGRAVPSGYAPRRSADSHRICRGSRRGTRRRTQQAS